MAETFQNRDGGIIVSELIKVIKDNAAYLSEIDGAIGDGDHGINMKKGFLLAGEALAGRSVDLAAALKTLGQTLLLEIGGSMGPLYGSFFTEMAKTCKGVDQINADVFSEMLSAGLRKVQDLGQARLGDKTLLDCLIPAVEAFDEYKVEGFAAALEEMKIAAKKGKDSTKDMVARVGRSSRLGERSRGVLDAGAVSCWLILSSMAESILGLLKV